MGVCCAYETKPDAMNEIDTAKETNNKFYIKLFIDLKTIIMNMANPKLKIKQ